jgi:antitoxin ParD1/3/4
MTESRDDASKLAALRAVAEIGFSDIEQGRYRDVTEAELDSYIAELGRQAHNRSIPASSRRIDRDGE